MKARAPQPLIIKKYENRRLYNTASSQYINQEQVAQLVRDGYDVHVIDAATGEDITRLILAQIVLEDAKTPDSVFPLDVLRQMVVASGKATQEGAVRYFKAMMDMYQTAYRAMPSPVNPFEFMPPFWGQSKPVGEPANPGKAGESSAAQVRPGATPDSEVTELRRRLEELETALSRHQAKGKSKGRKPRSRRKS
ncbi:MAG TPA: polyhydroxyalkanoate synthesis regulator DNA-binding domain-containing protein [Terriglobales bacterium]